MHFLCPNHRQRLVEMPEKEISNYWLEWMNYAGLYYELNQWADSIAFVGCAFDLTSCALFRRNINRGSMVTHVALSTIYLANTMCHQHDTAKANQVLSLSVQRLGLMMLHDPTEAWIEECLDILTDAHKHRAFFEEYLNLPFNEQFQPDPLPLQASQLH